MSTQRKPEYQDEDLHDDLVHDYLARHPDFFERYPSLLGTLNLPHAAGGAVSLVERQVSVLRQKDLKLERKLKELIEVARANDLLAAKIHQLSLQLVSSSGLSGTIVAVEEAVRAGFGADQAVLVLFGDPAAFDDIQLGRFFRAVERNDASLKPFATFMNGNGPRCGQIRDAQMNFLFHDDADEIGSVALPTVSIRG